MKRDGLFSVVLFINLAKFLCTVLIAFTRGSTLYFSIHSILILVALFHDQINTILRLILLIILGVIWIAILFFTVKRKKSLKAKSIYCMLSMVSVLFDFILPMIFSAVEVKIVSSVTSFVIMVLSLICFSKSIKQMRCV